MPNTSEPAPRLHHVGYAVDDLDRAAHQFAAAYGIGPFVTLPDGDFQRLEFRGQQCTWEHRLALAAWGDRKIEIQQAGEVFPPELAELVGRPTRLSHFGYRVDDVELEVTRLAQRSTVPFLHAETGPVRFRLVEDPLHASYIEILQEHPALQHMDEIVEEAARSWDGRHPLIAPSEV